MAPGAQRSPANRQAKRYSSAPHHPVAKALRISQSYHGSCTEWDDRIFPARFTSLDRHRAVSHLLRRSESIADGTAGAKSARWALHLAHVVEPACFLSNQ